jgi:thioredoxin reductase (NADPH)
LSGRTLQLTLYYREGCHLCATMLQALRRLQSRLDFALELVDIDAHPDLQRRYDEWVPVLSEGEHEICHYQLDEDALVQRCDAGAHPSG